MSAGVVMSASLVLSLGLYAWAIRAFFARTGPLPLAMRLLAGVGLIAGLCQTGVLLAFPPGWGLGTIGLSLHGAGLALFAWVLASVPRGRLPIAHSSPEPRGLSTGGPFAMLRHPCYAAYSLTWLGACVARPHAGTIGPACVMVAWYACLAVTEERRLLACPLASEYARYRRRVTWFGPNPFARRTPLGSAS